MLNGMTDALTAPPLPLDIVGTGEIAARCDVEETTVRSWRARGLLPPPDGEVGRAAWWHWSTLTEQAPPVARYLAEKNLTEAKSAAAAAVAADGG